MDGRHVSEYLTVQPKDPKAHKFLGQLFERDGETDKAVGCYKVRLSHMIRTATNHYLINQSKIIFSLFKSY